MPEPRVAARSSRISCQSFQLSDVSDGPERAGPPMTIGPIASGPRVVALPGRRGGRPRRERRREAGDPAHQADAQVATLDPRLDVHAADRHAPRDRPALGARRSALGSQNAVTAQVSRLLLLPVRPRVGGAAIIRIPCAAAAAATACLRFRALGAGLGEGAADPGADLDPAVDDLVRDPGAEALLAPSHERGRPPGVDERALHLGPDGDRLARGAHRPLPASRPAFRGAPRPVGPASGLRAPIAGPAGAGCPSSGPRPSRAARPARRRHEVVGRRSRVASPAGRPASAPAPPRRGRPRRLPLGKGRAEALRRDRRGRPVPVRRGRCAPPRSPTCVAAGLAGAAERLAAGSPTLARIDRGEACGPRILDATGAGARG